MKKLYILISILCIIVAICIGFLLLRGKNSLQRTVPISIPTPIQTNNTPTPSTKISIKAATGIFQNKTIQKELDLLENRRPLINTDTETKIRLIQSLPSDSETIYATTDYAVLYIKPIDEFQVEIKTTQAAQAKKDAITWFETQGMSFDGVCKLPVIFFTNHETHETMKSEGIPEISSLAEGC